MMGFWAIAWADDGADFGDGAGQIIDTGGGGLSLRDDLPISA